MIRYYELTCGVRSFSCKSPPLELYDAVAKTYVDTTIYYRWRNKGGRRLTRLSLAVFLRLSLVGYALLTAR